MFWSQGARFSGIRHVFLIYFCCWSYHKIIFKSFKMTKSCSWNFSGDSGITKLYLLWDFEKLQKRSLKSFLTLLLTQTFRRFETHFFATKRLIELVLSEQSTTSVSMWTTMMRFCANFSKFDIRKSFTKSTLELAPAQKHPRRRKSRIKKRVHWKSY